jgi:hypothetical protein
MTEREKILLIQEISKEMMKHSVKDQKGNHTSEHEKAVELLARAIHDFSDLYLNQQNNDEVLKGILAKVKIAYNTMERVKKPNIVIKRV